MKSSFPETRLFVFTSDKAHALISSDGQPPHPQDTSTPDGYIRAVPTAAMRLFDALKRPTRWAVKLLYFFPLVLLLKLAAWLLDYPQGDLFTLAFVALLLFFFGLLLFLLLLYPVVGPPSGRKKKMRRILQLEQGLTEALEQRELQLLALSSGQSLQRLCDANGPTPRTLRVRGRLRSGDGEQQPGSALLLDRWSAKDQTFARLLCSGPLYLEVPEAPPILLSLQNSPLIIGEYGPEQQTPPVGFKLGDTLNKWLKEQSKDMELEHLLTGEGITLHEGGECEMVATSVALVPDVEQAVVDGRRVQIPHRDPAGAPFRSSQVRRGLLLNDQPGAELIITPVD